MTPAELQAEVDQLRAALIRYGEHTPECALRMPYLRDPECNCGLDDAVRGES